MPQTATAQVRADTVVRAITACRLCRSPSLEPTWVFGETPLANAYLTDAELGKPEITAPLEVVRCPACELVQLRHTVDPSVLFSEYLYVSSTSRSFVAHFEAYANALHERFSLPESTLVVEIGSNDGVLLRPFKALGARVLGIEPARRIAAMATADGIETLPVFFSHAVAERVRAERGRAQIIAANNVFAHLPDIDDIVAGVTSLLADDGVFVFEVQYLGDLLKKNLFDIVYHEHLCYYHLTPLVQYFSRHGMEVFDVERVPVHGGSLRVFVQHAGGPHARHAHIHELLAEERERGLGTPAPYAAFLSTIQRKREALTALLRNLKQQGKQLAGYGAPAKATTLLHAFGIGSETLTFIVDDDSKFKQGRFMPGSHIPIVSPDRLYSARAPGVSTGTLYEDRPDACLILAWNFAEPIMQTHARFAEEGGMFIVPVPEPRMIRDAPPH